MNSCAVSNYIQRDGFVMVSNLLITYREQLGISNKELLFIIEIMKHKEDYKLHDEVLDPTVSPRTLQRRRKSLKDKGLLNFTVWRHTDENGHIYTEGITYDLSPLEEKLQEISNALAAEKVKKIEKEAENYILEYDEESPMAKYLSDWKEHYGDKYKVSATEKKWYNNLKEEDQKCIEKIFEYCEDNKLFGSITPRLALFMKNAIRWTQLKDYCGSNKLEEERVVSTLKEGERGLTPLEKLRKNKDK
jgi:hypothetical protein